MRGGARREFVPCGDDFESGQGQGRRKYLQRVFERPEDTFGRNRNEFAIGQYSRKPG